MNAVTQDDLAQRWVERLERRTADLLGVNRLQARRRVADRTGIPAGSLENIVRGRCKGVRAWIFDRLRAAALADLQREITAHEHELAAIARHPGGDLGGQVAAVAEALAGLKVRLRAASAE